jgi:hypothetical protein
MEAPLAVETTWITKKMNTWNMMKIWKKIEKTVYNE